MHRVLSNLCASAIVLIPALVVEAAPFFTVTGGAAYATSQGSFLWVGPRFGNDEVLLWEGGILGISEPGQITLEYIGKEAGYADNIFRWDGVDVFSTGPATPRVTGQTAAMPFPPPALASYAVSGDVPGGTLPFSFLITAAVREVFNDGSLDIALWPIPSDPGSGPANFGTTVYAMLDDGNAIDFDHDDMVVRLTVGPALPEPVAFPAAAAVAAVLVARRGRSRAGGRPPTRLRSSFVGG